jgi:hypothetical protein
VGQAEPLSDLVLEGNALDRITLDEDPNEALPMG